jgi:hypothetical protein
MWVVLLACVLAVAFLLVCLRGLNAAAAPEYTFQTIITTIEKKHTLGSSQRRPRLIVFPGPTGKVRTKRKSQSTGASC